MTRTEFLDALSAQLFRLTSEERESAVSYYREYLEEAGADEAAAIEALGSPQSVAERILREMDENRTSYSGTARTDYQYPLPDVPPAPQSNDTARVILTVIVLLVTMPIWITVLSLWLALEFALVMIPAGFAFAAIAAPIQGISEYANGMQGAGLWDIGCGILSLGLAMLCWKPVWLAVKYSAIGLFRLCKACIRGLLGKERQA